ncbi:hypothetical protein ACFX2G_047630 [Malus domestica]
MGNIALGAGVMAIAWLVFTLQVVVNAGDLEKLHDNASNPSPEELAVKRVEFPTDFVFGFSTAATQIEGSAKNSGKGGTTLLRNSQREFQTTQTCSLPSTRIVDTRKM